MNIKTIGDLKKFVELTSKYGIPDDIPILAQSSIGLPNGMVGYSTRVDLSYLNMENPDGTIGTALISVVKNGKGE